MFKKGALFIIVFLAVSSGAVMADGNQSWKDYSKVKLLRYMGEKPPGTYEDYLAGRTRAPFHIRRLPGPEPLAKPAAPGGKILVLVNEGIRQDIQYEMDRYVSDISANYTVELYAQSGGTAEDLKSFILSHGMDLSGCVFIGDIIAAWFEVSNDFDTYGYASFPCDLFFMDLDGAWTDADQDGKYDAHAAGDGDEGPEIFIGRIDTSMMSGDEVTLLKNYFDKDHAFWTGAFSGPYYGLTYTEDDWANYDDFRNDIGYAYPDYEAVAAPDTNGTDYISNRVPAPQYEFIQLSCHSGPTVHCFTRGAWVYSPDVISSVPGALFYNLFCCSSSRFTENDFLGGAYIYNTSTSSLATIGSSKTGSMLTFWAFYQPLGQGKCFGQAFKEWFDYLAPYDFMELCWHYGMTIAGDPMLIVRRPATDAVLAAGAGPGPANAARIQGFDENGAWNGLTDFTAFSQDVRYGVRLDAGDIQPDDLNEIIAGTGPGPGNIARVRAFQFDGVPVSGADVLAYGTASWGVNVAAGDIDGDGADEILTAPGPGPNYPGHVRGWKYQGGELKPMPGISFKAGSRWGCQVAAGDIDGDGFQEILIGAGQGPGNGPQIRAFNYDGSSVIPVGAVNFLAFGYRGYGVNVASGHVAHTGHEDIIAAPGKGPAFGPHVRGFHYDGGILAPVPGLHFFAYGPSLKYGAVVNCGDINNDGAEEILTGPGPGPAYGPNAGAWGYHGGSMSRVMSFLAFQGSGYRYGLNVAKGERKGAE